MTEFAGPQTLNIVEEITRMDGSVYREIGNLLHNGQAEYAVEAGMLKEVRILKINIPHSTSVQKYEKYVNDHFKVYKQVAVPEFIEWTKTEEMDAVIERILQENNIS